MQHLLTIYPETGGKIETPCPTVAFAEQQRAAYVHRGGAIKSSTIEPVEYGTPGHPAEQHWFSDRLQDRGEVEPLTWEQIEHGAMLDEMDVREQRS